MDVFYYGLPKSGKQVGPVSQEALAEAVTAGTVGPTTLVWSPGMSEWKALGQLPYLAKLVGCKVDATAAAAAAAAVRQQQQQQQQQQQPQSSSSQPTSSDAAETNAATKRTAEGGQPEELVPRKQKKAKKDGAGWKAAKSNTWVYVEGLPEDTKEEELVEFFKMCGIVMMDVRTKGPRVKVYRNEKGVCKGDACVCFLKAPSVELAVDLKDGALFRDKHPVRVTPAAFEKKDDVTVSAATGATASVRDAAAERAQKIYIMQQEAALSWAEDADTEVGHGHLRIIVLRHMFSPSEFKSEEDVAALAEEIKEEVSKLGPVDMIKVFEQSPEGVVVIKFKRPATATACINLMHGRYFGGQQIVCEYFDGTENFNPNKKETAEEEAKRLEEFGNWLEGGDSDDDDEDLRVQTEAD